MSHHEPKLRDDSGKEDSDAAISDSGSEEGEDSSDEELSESGGETRVKASANTTDKSATLVNQPFDEAVDLSESDGSIMSEDPTSPKKQPGRSLKNQPFDEALELSESAQEVESPKKMQSIASEKPSSIALTRDAKASMSITPGGTEMKNEPFDEQVDLSDSGESIDTNGQPSPKATAEPQRISSVVPRATSNESYKLETLASTSKAIPEAERKHESASSSEESESDDEDETPSVATTTAPHSASITGTGTTSTGSGSHATMMANAGGYKESDYAHLKVSPEIRELFQYIGRFKAQEIELEARLKCFIPEYIPAVGDMDAFLKVPRPDGQPDQLGLKLLDEPRLSQSDATVLDLHLRSTSKKKHGDVVVRSIENAEQSPREIDRWIKSIADLHRTKPPPQVHYTKTMPEIENLMQVWPEEFEEFLSKTTLPSAELDLGLEQYARVICALLDIPIHKNIFESLHVLFTLYLEFGSNQHFMPLL